MLDCALGRQVGKVIRKPHFQASDWYKLESISSSGGSVKLARVRLSLAVNLLASSLSRLESAAEQAELAGWLACGRASKRDIGKADAWKDPALAAQHLAHLLDPASSLVVSLAQPTCLLELTYTALGTRKRSPRPLSNQIRLAADSLSLSANFYRIVSAAGTACVFHSTHKQTTASAPGRSTGSRWPPTVCLARELAFG